MPEHAPLEVVARLGAHEIDRMPPAVLLERCHGAMRRVGLQVVKRCDRLRGIAEGRMAGDVVPALVADIDHPAVTQRLDVLFSAAQHVGVPSAAALSYRSPVRGGSSAL